MPSALDLITVPSLNQPLDAIEHSFKALNKGAPETFPEYVSLQTNGLVG